MTSPAGGSPAAASQPGSEKVYTEAELQRLVGAAQSSLQQRLNVADEARRAAERRAEQVNELEAELTEYKELASKTPDKVSEVKKRRELEAREQALDQRELGLERAAAAAELGIDPADVADASRAELRSLRIFFKAAKPAVKTDTDKKPEPRVPSRIPGSVTTPTLDGLLDKDISKMDYAEVLEYGKQFDAARRDVKLEG